MTTYQLFVFIVTTLLENTFNRGVDLKVTKHLLVTSFHPSAALGLKSLKATTRGNLITL